MNFKWDKDKIAVLTESVSSKIGYLHGRIAALGEMDRSGAAAEILTQDIVSSFKIEGINLNTDDVRSSVVKRLGATNIITSGTSSHFMEGVVDMMLDATRKYNEPLERERLWIWHSLLFPTGRSGFYPITVGSYRKGEVQVISGPMGHEKLHYMAPDASEVNDMMEEFLYWFNNPGEISNIVRSAISHLIFVSIHPFDDGNGRIGRAIADMALAGIDGGRGRFFSMSREIEKEKKEYYAILERTQRYTPTGDITPWLEWYVGCLGRAVDDSQEVLSFILNKSIFWREFSSEDLTSRQVRILNIYLDGKEGNITARNWARLGSISLDTAIRDITDLQSKGILSPIAGSVRKIQYVINYVKTDGFLNHFSDIKVEKGERGYYLECSFDDTTVRERISELDYNQLSAGKISTDDLVKKYMAYLAAEKQ